MHERNKKSHRHTNIPDFIAESFAGQLVYHAIKKTRGYYPEEHDDWQVPDKYYETKGKKLGAKKMRSMNMEGWQQEQGEGTNENADRTSQSSDRTVVQQDQQESSAQTSKKENKQEKVTKNEQQNRSRDEEEGGRPLQGDDNDNSEDRDPDRPPPDSDPNIVTWYSKTDPANPQNWSLFKKCAVTAELCLLTFSIYIGSAIYSPGYESLNMDFGVSSTVATLGLTLFVIGYGIGPLFLAPLSEIPQIGRTPPYVITLTIFVVMQALSATVQNFAGLMTLRFIAGFFGSPVLATGGASLQDMFSDKTRPYAVGIWGMSAVCGPVLGPLLGGFAIQAESWRWAFWILLWLDGFCLAMLLFFFPETSTNNILYRRAVRLRKRTGNNNLRSQSEIVASKMTGKEIIKMTLLLPIVYSFTEPICLALNLYIGLVYAILYCFIESFQLVFVQIYGFNLGENGLSYLGLFVGAIVAYAGFCIWNHYSQIPDIRRYKGKLPPERRLLPAFVGCWFLPICLFTFGATSVKHVHWIAPIIFSSFFSIAAFLLFQACLNYLQDAYPERAASVLAGNDFFRSMMGGIFPLFSTYIFQNLNTSVLPDYKVIWGCFLLGGISILFIPIPFVLYKYGKQIRMRSKNARHDL